MKIVNCLATSVVALAASGSLAMAAEWSLDVGGYYDIGLGFDDSAGGEGILRDGEIHFKPTITLDNGLRFSGVVDLDDAVDETPVIRGSFGEIRIGSEFGSVSAPNAAIISLNSGTLGSYAYDPSTGAGEINLRNTGSLSATDPATGENTRIRYFTPRFAGFQLGVSYASDSVGASTSAVSDAARLRASLVTEVGLSLTAGYSYEYDLEGTSAGASFSVADGNAGILPSFWTFGIKGYDLSGSAEVRDIDLPGGFGIPHTGDVPGLYFAAPSVVEEGRFSSEVRSAGADIRYTYPLGSRVRFDTSGIRSIGTSGVFGGVTAGQYEQTDVNWALVVSDFGASGIFDADIRYDVKFDGGYFGAYAGYGYTHEIPLDARSSIGFSGSAFAGINSYSLDVADRLSGTYFSGLSTLSSSRDTSQSDSALNAGITGAVTYATGAAQLSGYVSTRTGPSLIWERPDSDLSGPLDGRLSIDAEWQTEIGAMLSIGF